jgi:hypothetical protein
MAEEKEKLHGLLALSTAIMAVLAAAVLLTEPPQISATGSAADQ